MPSPGVRLCTMNCYQIVLRMTLASDYLYATLCMVELSQELTKCECPASYHCLSGQTFPMSSLGVISCVVFDTCLFIGERRRNKLCSKLCVFVVTCV